MMHLALVSALLAAPGMTIAVQRTKVADDAKMILLGLEILKSQGHDVCITFDKHYELGGLANTVGMVNTVLDFAMKNNLGWIQPEIRPPAHLTGDAFRFMFGQPRYCTTRMIPLYTATCPFQLRQNEMPEGHCPINETFLHSNTVYSLTQCEPSCSVLVMVSSIIDWMFDYSNTAGILSSMYWERRGALGDHVSSEMQFPLSTAVHVRLGDVQGTGDMKEFDATKFKAIMEGLTSMIDPRCLTVELHTDAEANDITVQDASASWTNLGVADVKIFDVTVPEVLAFDRLTSANILIGGPSGFSRLAAVLGHAYIKLFLNDYYNTHPIEFLSGTTTLTNRMNTSQVTKGLAANAKMTAATEGCKAWLGE